MIFPLFPRSGRLVIGGSDIQRHFIHNSGLLWGFGLMMLTLGLAAASLPRIFLFFSA